jgi:adenosylhomocysteine nucleosidase
MTVIAIITAMDSEFNAIKSLYDFTLNSNIMTAKVYDKTIYLIKSGIGKVNAALKADFVIRNGANIVITTGLAGGIDCCLEQGSVVLADKVCYHDVWCGSPNLKGQIQDLPLYYELEDNLKGVFHSLAINKGFKFGLTVTGDQFLTDVNRLNQIKTDFPEALAVDMESAAIAQTCYLNNIPYISLRIISDVVGKEGQVDEYNNFWQNVPTLASTMVDDVLQIIP